MSNIKYLNNHEVSYRKPVLAEVSREIKMSKL